MSRFLDKWWLTFLVRSKFSPFYTTIINVVFWTVSLVPAAFPVWDVEGISAHEDSQGPGVKVVEQLAEKKDTESQV